MKEKIYTIPINDAFLMDCECPICAMKTILEKNAVEFVMGPSYMEDDIRMETDRLGFCKLHMQMIFDQKNKLGMALVLKTHVDRTNKEIEKRMKLPVKTPSLFKKEASNPLTEYIDQLNHSCYICDRIDNNFGRYVQTVVETWKSDRSFRELYAKSKGFCTEHYGELIKQAEKHLGKNDRQEFVEKTGTLYLENMKRIAEELEWFADKFDYRYKDAPWKNSKDSIPRAMTKLTGILNLDEKKTQ